MKLNRFALKFYTILLLEVIFWPILTFINLVSKFLSSKTSTSVKISRKPVKSKVVHVCVHEWGGYSLSRLKKIKKGRSFTCGLLYHLSRFNLPVNKYEVRLIVTLSESDKCGHLSYIKDNCSDIIFVSNAGMDFTGYSTFFNRIKDYENAYVILSNSSVNEDQERFLEGYLDYMENNQDVGMLGVSYCTKKIQSLVKNNFTPHLQGFFYLTTIDVLCDIVRRNSNRFPGEGINHKLLLIREGEIKMSQTAMDLGYNLAVVQEDGTVYKFGKKNRFDCGYNSWSICKGDVRQINLYPNRINKIAK